MLFNSLVFIAGFLPVVLAGFLLLAAGELRRPAMVWLVLASLLFYGWWDYRNLFIILPSIIGNYAFGWAIGALRPASPQHAKTLLVLGIAGNLGAIG